MTESHGYHTTCKANGCPLMATEVTDYWPRESKSDPLEPRWGLCKWHHQAHPEDWPAVSAATRRNKHELRVMQELEAITNPATKPGNAETVAEWVARISATVAAQTSAGSHPEIAQQSIRRINEILRQ